jgi:DNA-binding CsgD family transcriptional regulator
METLSHNDLIGLNRAIGEIYATRDREMFFQSVFNSIQSLIPCELCSFNDVDLHPLRFLKVTTSSQQHHKVSSKLLPVFNAHIKGHPLAPQFFLERVFKTRDCASRNHFKDTAIYNEYYKHLDIETQIGFSVPVSREKTALFALSRKSPDFSERDRLLLTLLKPHMVSALRNAMEIDRIRLERDLLQKGAEAERQGAVLFQSDGVVLCISPVAKELLARYIDAELAEGDTLPGPLLKWFKAGSNDAERSCVKSAYKESTRRVERAPLILEQEDRCIKITLLNDFTTGDYVFVITETDHTLPLHDLEGYDLSRREIEVLSWISKGKTNAEIAVILGASRRTVEKHMEHIFAKLGVETRAAAAAVMRD